MFWLEINHVNINKARYFRQQYSNCFQVADPGIQWPLAAGRAADTLGFGMDERRTVVIEYLWMYLFYMQILGYDSLEVIPLLALVILSFRKESLMQVGTLENIETVLADLSSIKVLPLIQLSLSLKE